MNNKFEKEWQTYRQMAVAAQAHPQQLKETKRAFYAGASSVITFMAGRFEADKKEPGEDDVKILEDVWKEIEVFFDDERKAAKKFELKKDEVKVIVNE